MGSLLFFAVFVVFMVGVSIWSRAKIKKTQEQVASLLSEARTFRSAGKPAEGLECLYRALRYAVGIGSGTTEWTAKGLCRRMDERGWSLVSEIEGFQREFGLTYDWSEFKQTIKDFQQFSLDKKLVDRYGLPKRAGKDIYAAMKAKLGKCMDSMPKIVR